MRDNKKLITGSVVALAVIIVLGIVYAAFTQQLNINGSATGRSSKWKVYFSRLTGPTLNGTAKELVAPEIKNGSTTIGDYSVSVTSPGDYIEYEFDVTNDGDYDAKLTGLTKNSNTGLTYTGSGANKTTDENNVKSQIEYTLTYADGTTVLENDTLKSKETKTMKLKLLYKTFSDASLLPQEDVSISGLGITLTYSQDSNAKVNKDGTTPYVKSYPVYSIGDTITIGTDNYYVIEDTDSTKDYVTLLKENPLTVNEVNTYGASISVSAYDKNGFGGMSFGYTSDYSTSSVKTVVDTWAADRLSNVALKTVDGYSTRLITVDELADNFGYTNQQCTGSCWYNKPNDVPSWLYDEAYNYWTMSPYNDSSKVWFVYTWGGVGSELHSTGIVVRPVINVYKSAISS